MGSSNGVSRGQLRPHFGGRNPPFLVAALCVGIGILAVSYYSLSSQYTALQMQLEAFGKEEQLIETQLHAKEDECSKHRLAFEKKQKEFDELLQQVKAKEQDITKLNAQLASLRESNDKYNEEIGKKDNEIGDAKIKIQEQEKSITELQNELSKEKAKNTQLQTQLEEKKNARSTAAVPNVLPRVASEGDNKANAAQNEPKADGKANEIKTDTEKQMPAKNASEVKSQMLAKSAVPTQGKKADDNNVDEELKNEKMLVDTEYSNNEPQRDKPKGDGDNENTYKEGENTQN